jgi:hypothetical protein
MRAAGSVPQPSPDPGASSVTAIDIPSLIVIMTKNSDMMTLMHGFLHASSVREAVGSTMCR